MSYNLRFRVEAERDLEEIQDYYNKINPAITNNFFIEFFETMDFIEDEPKPYQVRYRGISIAPLHRFPFGVHYREIEDEIIIYRVLHTKRYFK